MNTVQKIIVVLGIVAMVYFGFINPATYDKAIPNPGYNPYARGGSIFSNPAYFYDKQVSVENTALRILIVAIATGGLVFVFKDKKKEEEKH